MNRAGRKLGGGAYESVSSREVWSRAAQTAELKELRCPISASHGYHHLPPGSQEPQSCKLPPLFQFAPLAGAAQLLPQTLSQPGHILQVG